MLMISIKILKVCKNKAKKDFAEKIILDWFKK